MHDSLIRRATFWLLLAFAIWAPVYAAPDEAAFPVLTNLVQLRQLPQAEARKGYPLEIRGIVSCFDATTPALFLQAGEEAVYVRYPVTDTPIHLGDEVIIKGFSLGGDHNYISASSARVINSRRELSAPITLKGTSVFDTNLDCKRVAVAGTIERVKVDGPKWIFSVRQNGREFVAQLLKPRAHLDPRDWVGSRVEFTGPASIRRLGSQQIETRIVCSGISDVCILVNPGAPHPVRLGDLAQLASTDQWLVVTGKVSAVSSASIALREGNAQLSVAAPPFSRVGDEVELSGFAVSENGSITLNCTDAHVIERDASGARKQVVTSIAQIRALTTSEADLGLPVRVRAVVTYSEAGSHELFIHDGARGIFVWLNDAGPALPAGLEVEVAGKTSAGLFAPIIDGARVTRGRKTETPTAKAVSVIDILSGREDAAVVQIAGVVRRLESKDNGTEFQIVTAAGKIDARVPVPVRSAKNLEHAIVRVSGVASGKFNDQRQIVAALIFIPDLESVVIEEPAASNPYSLNRIRLHEVFRYRGESDLMRRVCVSGVVAWQAPEGGIYLSDGGEKLFVQAAFATNIVIGSRVEAVGYPAMGVRFTPILSDSVVRVVDSADSPKPRIPSADDLRNGSMDAALVKIRAKFIQGYAKAGVWRTRWETEGAAPQIFDALLVGKRSPLQRETVADLTGVVRALMDDEHKPVGFELFLRSPSDIAVISTPGFWTADIMWRVLCALGLFLLFVLGWVRSLRQKVNEQTAVVKQQLAREEMLQRQYLSIFDNNPHPMWVFDPKTLRFLAVNETAVLRYGYSREEFLSMTIMGIRSSVEQERLREFISSGMVGVEGVLVQHRRKDGSMLLAEITWRQITFSGEPATLVLANNVTERFAAENALRISEAKFRRIVESSLIGIAFFNKEGAITEANDCLLSMFGRSREDLKNSPFKIEDFSPADRHEHLKLAMHELRTQGKSAPKRREFLHRDGRRVPAMVGAVALDPETFVAFVLDLTKETTLEQQVLISQKMEAVGLLAGGVAHDFNNLLQVIQGYTLLSIEGGTGNADLLENLRHIKGAAERAADLTRQLLFFSRQDNLQESEINVQKTLTDIIKLVRRVIGEHIEVAFTAASDLHHIRADKGRIEQVLMNLCVNARDAMPKGGRLTIELSNATLTEADTFPFTKDSGPYVCIRVTDTGCGMDAATLARIYEPFFTTKSKEKGSGLGLSIVYGIIERHRGIIRVQSQPGAGTTFLVYFPAVIGGETTFILKPAETADKTGMETILLVEDEPAVRTLAARVLKRAGYEVRTASDGAEACDVFNAHAEEIDLVLMDVIMPKMSGRDAYENIAKTRRDIPVIFCSGYSERELGAEFLQTHSLDLLPKPYRPDELLTRIRERLHPTKSS